MRSSKTSSQAPRASDLAGPRTRRRTRQAAALARARAFRRSRWPPPARPVLLDELLERCRSNDRHRDAARTRWRPCGCAVASSRRAPATYVWRARGRGRRSAAPGSSIGRRQTSSLARRSKIASRARGPGTSVNTALGPPRAARGAELHAPSSPTAHGRVDRLSRVSTAARPPSSTLAYFESRGKEDSRERRRSTEHHYLPVGRDGTASQDRGGALQCVLRLRGRRRRVRRLACCRYRLDARGPHEFAFTAALQPRRTAGVSRSYRGRGGFGGVRGAAGTVGGRVCDLVRVDGRTLVVNLGGQGGSAVGTTPGRGGWNGGRGGAADARQTERPGAQVAEGRPTSGAARRGSTTASWSPGAEQAAAVGASWVRTG